MKANLERLFWGMCLENTRLLVKGVIQLHQEYQRDGQSNEETWSLDELQEFVVKAYSECVQNNNYLAQNPHVELFQFRRPKPDIEWMNNTDSIRLSGMLLLYHQLQILEELPSDRMAEAYEILCNSIRSILEADMCYLVSRHLADTYILSASSVMEKDLDRQLGSEEAGELLDQLGEENQFFKLIEGIFVKQEPTTAESKSTTQMVDEWRTADDLILPIMLYDKNGRLRDEQIYLICERRDKTLWCKDAKETVLRVRDTLFLRGQLAQALVRDLTNLLTVAREYRDISRKTPEIDPLRVFHISDLHVTRENCDKLKRDIQKLELGKISFDFLVITGDAVQGRYAAGDLELHYDCAAQVIRALAFHMWSEEQGGKRVLCQDWKRRTIIIPGNHDYASMNELETQHGESHRSSLGGRPATQEGSAMAKFTYYINFVRKLLDIEVGEIIDNGLNELRCYDKMGVDFLCFNTSIMANPARNNKVHLDQGFVYHAIRRLSERREKNRITVFLGHHGPSYTIDYLSDEYLEPFICHRITKRFREAVQVESELGRRDALEKLKQDMESLESTKSGDDIVDNDFVQTWLLKNQMKALPIDVKEKVIERRKKTRLYNHLLFLLEQLNKGEVERSINERYQKIIAEVNRSELLSQNDKKAYHEVFNILEQLEITVCLSGHTHIWDEDRSRRYFVAKRFSWEQMIRAGKKNEKLKQISLLNYGICEILAKNRSDAPKIEYHKVEAKIADD